MARVLYVLAMTRPPDDRLSRSDLARRRAMLRDTVPAVLVLVVVQGSLLLLDPQGGASGWNLAWSLLPLLPVGWLVWAQLRSLRRADELQRTVQLEAMAIAFGAVLVLSLAGGLLDAAGLGDPRQSLQVTFIGGVLTWLGALLVLGGRAR